MCWSRISWSRPIRTWTRRWRTKTSTSSARIASGDMTMTWPTSQHSRCRRIGSIEDRQRFLQAPSVVQPCGIAHCRGKRLPILVPAALVRITRIAMFVACVVTFRTARPVAGVHEQFTFAQKGLTGSGDCCWSVGVIGSRRRSRWCR